MEQVKQTTLIIIKILKIIKMQKIVTVTKIVLRKFRKMLKCFNEC